MQEEVIAAVAGRRGTLIAGISGVLWPVLALARIPLTQVLDQPSWTADRSSILQFYTDAHFSAAFVSGMALVSIAYVLFLVFMARVADLVRSADGGSSWAGHLIFGGAVLDTGLVFAYLAPFAVAVFWAGHGGLSTDGYLTLHGLSFGFLWLELTTLTLWLAALGVAVVRTRVFPRWLGWVFLANSAATLASFFLPYAAWTVAGGLPYLWVLIAAATMVTRPDRYSAPDVA